MPQVYGPDVIPDLAIATTTTVTLGTSYLGKQTRITVGGQSYPITSTITLNFATTGLNALDTGVITLNTLYYIYCVVSGGGVAGLVASTAAPTTGPTGYTAWKEVGRCRTFLASATLAAISNRDGDKPRKTNDETQSFTPVVSGFGTSPTLVGYYSRSGNCMSIRAKVSVTNVAGASTFSVNVPSGFSMDASRTPPAALLNTCTYTHGGTAVTYVGSCYNGGITAFGFYGGNGATAWNATVPAAITNSHSFTLDITIPITEWQGLYT